MSWQEVERHHLERTYAFKDFMSALAFVNKVAVVAEELGHHPDVELSWGRVVLKLRTHDERAITEKDRALAARIDTLP